MDDAEAQALAACRRERSRGLASRSSGARPSQEWGGDSTEHDHRQNTVGDDALSWAGSMPSLSG